MDKKSKALSWIIALAIIASVCVTFYRTIVVKDFVMTGGEEVSVSNGEVETSSTTTEAVGE